MAFSINHRRLLAASFILAFLITAPLLLLYASGYRYQLKTGQLIRATGLTVFSAPRGATVLLNDQPTGETTPWHESNLGGGRYAVTLLKTGYFPWQKTIVLLPGTAKLFDKVILLRDPQTDPTAKLQLPTAPLTAPPAAPSTVSLPTKTYTGFKLVTNQAISPAWYLYQSLDQRCLLLSANRQVNPDQQFCWPETIKGWQWSNDDNTNGLLLVYGNHQAGYYLPTTKTLTTAVRITDQLLAARWLPKSPYLITLTKKEVKAVETQDPLAQNLTYHLLESSLKNFTKLLVPPSGEEVIVTEGGGPTAKYWKLLVR